MPRPGCCWRKGILRNWSGLISNVISAGFVNAVSRTPHRRGCATYITSRERQAAKSSMYAGPSRLMYPTAPPAQPFELSDRRGHRSHRNRHRPMPVSAVDKIARHSLVLSDCSCSQWIPELPGVGISKCRTLAEGSEADISNCRMLGADIREKHYLLPKMQKIALHGERGWIAKLHTWEGRHQKIAACRTSVPKASRPSLSAWRCSGVKGSGRSSDTFPRSMPPFLPACALRPWHRVRSFQHSREVPPSG